MRVASQWFLEGLGSAILSAVLLCSAAGAVSLEASVSERAEGAPGLVLLQFEVFGGASVGAASLELATTLSDLRPGASVEFAQLSIIGGPGALPSVDEITELLPRSRHFYVHGTRSASVFEVGGFVVRALQSGAESIWMALDGQAGRGHAQVEIDMAVVALLHLQESGTIQNTSPDLLRSENEEEGGLELKAASAYSAIEQGKGLIVGPNPARSSTTVSFIPKRHGFFEISVFDLRGREIFSQLQEGNRGVRVGLEWAGLSNDGARVSAGVYAVRVLGPDFRQVRSFVLLR